MKTVQLNDCLRTEHTVTTVHYIVTVHKVHYIETVHTVHYIVTVHTVHYIVTVHTVHYIVTVHTVHYIVTVHTMYYSMHLFSQLLSIVLRCWGLLLNVIFSYSSARCIRWPGFALIRLSCRCVIDVMLLHCVYSTPLIRLESLFVQ